MQRDTYEVRVREKFGPNSVKKSRFYKASSPKEAAQNYKGNGHIMWVEKVPKEKLLGIGSFFTLGDVLLKELKRQDELTEVLRNKEKKKVKDRRYIEKKRKLALD